MWKGVCRVLKGLFVTGWLCLQPALAGIYYVDGACSTNGNGTSINCGSTGPWNKLSSVNWSSVTAGSTIYIRGPQHPTHGSGHVATNNFDGRYFHREPFQWINRSFSPVVTLMTYPGDNYAVVEGSKCPPGGSYSNDSTNQTSCGLNVWTPCSDCTSGICANVPAAMCSSTWYTTNPDTQSSGFDNDTGQNYDILNWAVTPWGTPTYGVTSISDLTNNHASFNYHRCQSAMWKPCTTDSDCTGTDGACSATVPEIDSYACVNNVASNCTGTNRLFVAWGTVYYPGSGNNNRPYIPYRYGSTFLGGNEGTLSGITVKNLIVRNYVKSPINLSGSGVSNITFDGVQIYHVKSGDMMTFLSPSSGDGGSRAIEVAHITSLTVTNSEMGFVADEGIHAYSRISSGQSPLIASLQVTNNWIQHTGAASIFGPSAHGTPSGITMGDDGELDGDWNGSHISGNVIQNTESLAGGGGSVGYGVRIESASNLAIHDNVIQNTGGAQCILIGKAQGQNTKSDSNSIYNNLLLSCGSRGIDFVNSFQEQSNLVYNNTIITPAGGTTAIEGCSGSCTGNLIRNNIIYTDAGQKLINWTNVDATNILENNNIYTSANPAATWQGAHVSGGPGYSCANINSGNIAASDKCVAPSFVYAGGSDYHFNAFAVAPDATVDGGSSTGNPSGHTLSIYNTLASLHGLPSYADGYPQGGTAWDMGAAELMLSDGGVESGAFGTGKFVIPDVADCACLCGNSIQSGVILGGSNALSLSTGGCDSGSPCGECPSHCGGEAVYGCGNFHLNLTNLTVSTLYSISGFYQSTTGSITGPTLSDKYVAVYQDPATVGNPYCHPNSTFFTGKSVCDICGISLSCDGSWCPFSCIFQAENTNTTLVFFPNGSSGGSVYFDNITIKPFVLVP